MIGCEDVELLLADRGGDATLMPAVAAHVKNCDECMRLLREVDQPVVVDALDEASGAGNDLAELTTVSAELYVRGKEIGRGGMGRIVRAHDRRLGRSVAIKELLDERMRGRFEREARLTARLQHPAIVSVHEAGIWPSGEPFYAMKYVAGRPLTRVIEETHTPAERIALLPHVITVVEAIAYAHSERVIHRDLKPHNILVGAFGETVVIDWGLAKDLSASEPEGASDPYRDDGLLLTRAGAGTPAYMPPEQARGEAPDERIDVYALGATLYHVIAGSPPRPMSPKRLADVAPAAPRELCTIVDKAMAYDPAARYPSAGELAADLRRFQNGQLVAAHSYSLGQLAGRWLRRHRLAVATVATFIAALAGLGAVSVARIVAARQAADVERDRARSALAEMLVERGRQESLDGSPARALVYLHAALAAGVDTPALRFLLGEASRTTEQLRLALDGSFRAVAISPDGKLLATSDPLRLWDAASGAERATLDARAARLLFDRDGGRLLAVDKTRAEIWDVAAARRVAVLPHAGSIEGAAFSPDGGRVVTWSDGLATVWTAGGERLADLRGQPRDIRGAAFDARGERVLTGSVDGDAHVWEAASGRKLMTLGPHSSGVTAGAFDPTGPRIATAGWDRQVTIWDGPGKALRKLDLGESVRVVTYTPDGAFLLAHGTTNVRLWKADSGQLVAHLVEGSTGVAMAQLLGDGTRILVVGRDGVARIFDLTGRTIERFEGHPGPLFAGAASIDGQRVVSLGGDRLVVWQPGGRNREQVLLNAQDLAQFDGRGRLLLGTSRPRIWDPEKGGLSAVWTGERLRWLVIARFERDRVHVIDGTGKSSFWDPGSGGIEIGPPIDGVVEAMSARGDRAVRSDGFLQSPMRPADLIDVATGKVIRQLETYRASAFFFSPDGARLALVEDGACAVRETDSGRLVLSVSSVDRLRGVRFSPDGTKLFVFGDSADGELWDLANGRPVLTLRGHAEGIWTAAFSHDGALLLTGGRDGNARMWDLATGQELAAWTLPGGAVRVVEVDARGRWAYLATQDAARVISVASATGSTAEIGAQIARLVPFGLIESRLVPSRLAAGARPARPAERPAREGCPPGTRAYGGRPPEDLLEWCGAANGIPRGPSRLYWPNGQVMEEAVWDGDEIVGTWTLRDEEGRVVQTIEYLDRRRSRLTKFHENGARAVTYDRQWDTPSGPYRAWYPSGKLREEGRFPRCEEGGCKVQAPEGLWTTYYEDGRVESQGMYISRPEQPQQRQLRGASERLGRWTFTSKEGVTRSELFPCPAEQRFLWTSLSPQPVCK